VLPKYRRRLEAFFISMMPYSYFHLSCPGIVHPGMVVASLPRPVGQKRAEEDGIVLQA
jgi:hypothetical protein